MSTPGLESRSAQPLTSAQESNLGTEGTGSAQPEADASSFPEGLTRQSGSWEAQSHVFFPVLAL